MKEHDFLEIGVEKIGKIYDEIYDEESFFKNSPEIRFYKYKEIFTLYFELITHEKMQKAIKEMKQNEYVKIEPYYYEFFSFIRNVIIHFPIYTTWDEVYIDEELLSWNKKKKSIHTFLVKYNNTYKFLELHDKKKNTTRRIVINLHIDYDKGKGFYLKNVLPEKDALVLFLSIIWEIIYILTFNY